MAEVTIDQVPKEVRDLFNRGFSAFERGNLDYAIDMLMVCVEREPRLLQARKFLRAAEVQRVKSKKSGMIKTAFSTLKGVPSLAKVRAAKEPLQAVMIAESLLKADPLNVKFIKAFAQAAVSADLPEAAIQTLEVARDHHPNDIPIINWLGTLYQKVGRTKSARECFEKLCEICPNDPEALSSLKDAMAIDSMSSDGWQTAADDGGSYRDIIEDEEEAHLLEQETKAVKNEEDADDLIASTLEKIKTERENTGHYRRLARLYGQKGLYDKAVAILEDARKVSPGDPELENHLISMKVKGMEKEVEKLREAGQEDEANEKEFEKKQFEFDTMQDQVKRYPNDLRLRYEWGIMLYENDYTNEAIQQFQLSQRSPTYRIKSLYFMAMCFRAKEQYDLAIEQLEQAGEEIYSMDDTKKDIYYQIGEIAELLGDRGKAAEYYKRIYQSDIAYKDIAEKIEKVYKKSE